MHTSRLRLDYEIRPSHIVRYFDLLIDDGLILVDPNKEVVRANQSSFHSWHTYLNQPLEYFLRYPTLIKLLTILRNLVRRARLPTSL